MNRQRRGIIAAGAVAGLSTLAHKLTLAGDIDDGRHDFDFYFGHWSVHVRRLTKLMVHSNDWLEYAATDESRPILAGLGCIDHFVTHWDGHRVGMALRLFNPQTRLWSIYWADNGRGVLDPAVVGSFKQGVGTFIGHDSLENKPILVRNIWRDVAKSSVRWEQAFSPDEGVSWETNCVMQMTRV